MAKKTAALILAAGEGKRMRSSLPKVMHCCADLPLIGHVVRLALARRCDPVVVVISPRDPSVKEWLQKSFPTAPLRFSVQKKPLGTGDAVKAGLTTLGQFNGQVLILYGDVPLLRASTLARLSRALSNAKLAILTAEVDDPHGYGRVVRVHGHPERIVEDRDTTLEQKSINEINVGVYLTTAQLLRRALASLNRQNAQHELYLTDIVAILAKLGPVRAVLASTWQEVRGVNSRSELAAAESVLFANLVAEHQRQGVTFRDPASVRLTADVRLGRDVTVGAGVQFYGSVKVGENVRIEGPSVIRDTVIAAGAVIEAFSHLEGARVGRGAKVGPFARLRPQAQLDENVRVGNFVEVKKARLHKGAKANHLAYLGDAEVGSGSNIGAGTITCNYDGGPVKHQTHLGRQVFVGSNTTLVAPVKVGARAYIAAGSTITKDVPSDALSFGRARQTDRPGYAKKLRERIKGKREH